METQCPLLESQEPRDDEAIVDEKDTAVLLRLRSRSFTAPLLSPKYSFLHCFSSLSHLVLLMSLGAFCLAITAFWPNCSQCACGDGPWSPAKDYLEFEDRKLDAYLDQGSFVGEPSDKTEEAWADMMRGMNMRILPSEMLRIGADSLRLSDGSGYVGALSVYHELHCIKIIRQWFFKDHFFANLTQKQFSIQRRHTEHCIESLRKSSICHADITVLPYHWLHSQDDDNVILGPSPLEHQPQHRCVRWDRLQAWTRTRHVDLSDWDSLVPEREYME